MARGLLMRGTEDEESEESEDDGLEEQYMKMMPKIGRDFVHRDDLAVIMNLIMQIVDPFGLSPIDFTSTSEATSRAREYKSFLDDSKKGSDVYKDLINLEDDED